MKKPIIAMAAVIVGIVALLAGGRHLARHLARHLGLGEVQYGVDHHKLTLDDVDRFRVEGNSVDPRSVPDDLRTKRIEMLNDVGRPEGWHQPRQEPQQPAGAVTQESARSAAP